VRFIDAAGLGCLVSFANRLAASGAKISVLGASPRYADCSTSRSWVNCCWRH